MEKYDNKKIEEVRFTKYKIVVPTEQDREDLVEAFEHIHYADIDTNNVPVNQLAHEYLRDDDNHISSNNLIVDPKLYEQLVANGKGNDNLANQVIAWLRRYRDHLPSEAVGLLQDMCGVPKESHCDNDVVTLIIKGKEYQGEFVYEEISKLTERRRRIPTKIRIRESSLDDEGKLFLMQWFKSMFEVDGMQKLNKSDYVRVVPFKIGPSSGILHGCFIVEHEYYHHFMLTFDFIESVQYKAGE